MGSAQANRGGPHGRTKRLVISAPFVRHARREESLKASLAFLLYSRASGAIGELPHQFEQAFLLLKLWQMTGFFLGWGGSPGHGRALGGEIKLTGQVTNDVKLVEYGIDIKRVVRSRVALGIAEGFVKVDGKLIYEAKDLRVGLFPGLGAQSPAHQEEDQA